MTLNKNNEEEEEKLYVTHPTVISAVTAHQEVRVQVEGHMLCGDAHVAVGQLLWQSLLQGVDT